MSGRNGCAEQLEGGKLPSPMFVARFQFVPVVDRKYMSRSRFVVYFT